MSYDQKQKQARLIACAVCGKPFYATDACEGWKCVACR